MLQKDLECKLKVIAPIRSIEQATVAMAILSHCTFDLDMLTLS
jgi:hypothetical protein